MPDVLERGLKVRPLAGPIHLCKQGVFHTTPVACLAAGGEVYGYTAANDGPETGHGHLVVLDCPHRHAVALKRDEMEA